MQENKMLEQIRHTIQTMRKFKSDNRLCGGVRVFVGEDVLSDLLAGGGLVSQPTGKYSLDSYPVLVVKGYPKGYISAE